MSTAIRSTATEAILERDGELGRLQRFLASGLEHDGATLAIEGPMGIGKTRLLDEARTLAADQGYLVLGAAGGELERDFPFGVVLGLFDSVLAKRGAAARRSLFRGRASAARDLLLGEQADPKTWSSPTDEFALLHGLYWFTANLAEEQPLALLIDDVHWADPLSARFLLYLTQRLVGLPVTVIVTVRSGEPRDDDLIERLLTGSRVETVRPQPLSRAGVASMMCAGSAACDEAVADDSWELTGGNPFLVRALRQALLRGESFTGDELTGAAPESVSRALVLHVQSLGSHAVALSQAAAVLGPACDLNVAARVAALDDNATSLAVGRLDAAHVLVEAPEIRFSHPIYRSAMYGALEPQRRGELHARAAHVLHEDSANDDAVAHHLMLGAAVSAPWASETLQRAARLIARRGAPDAAVRMIRRALESDPASPTRASMLLDLGIVEAASGEEVSLRHFTEAAASFDTAREKADALCALGKTLYRYGRFAEAEATLASGLELARRADDPLFALDYEASYICAATYVPARAIELEKEVAATVASLMGKPVVTDQERALLAAGAMLLSYSAMSAAQLTEVALRALGDGALLRHSTADGMVLYMAIEVLLAAGRFAEATSAIDAALSEARDANSLLASAEASQLRAMIMRAQGKLAEAAADAEAAIAGRDIGYGQGHGVSYSILAECLLDRGDLEGARAALSEAERHATPPATLWAWPMAARGRLLMAEGRAPEAFERFQAAGRLLVNAGIVNPGHLPWRSSAARAAQLAGRPEEARALAEEELELARAYGAEVCIGRALRAWGQVVGGRDGMRALLEAIPLLERSGAELELAKALVDLGRAQRRAGQRSTARERLRRGLQLAYRCDAGRLIALAQDELQAAGARPRRQAVTGLQSLTPTELRVARLAASGRSNRAIAEELFVTKNTVDWHLRNAYQKLGVHSRAELAAVIEKG